MRAIPHIAGYVQNRPLRRWWEQLVFPVCAEAWFPDRAAELAGMSSDYALGPVADDEARFIDRERSWTSAVTAVELLQDRPRTRFRLLAFDEAESDLPDIDGRLERLRLHRPAPGTEVAAVLSAWSDDVDQLESLAAERGPLAFVAEPAAFLIPPAPEHGWEAVAAQL